MHARRWSAVNEHGFIIERRTEGAWNEPASSFTGAQLRACDVVRVSVVPGQADRCPTP
ncbi:hypothetical protein ACFL6C_02375 [Myxococcota bacterium]